jgi:branched-chain amino acid transport system substrate-binding protein
VSPMLRRTVATICVLVAAAALTACSSSSGGSGASSPSSGASSSADAPRGAPIVIGFLNTQGANAVFNIPNAIPAAQAAVDYVNANGGVDGRPLKLSTCISLGTPASDTQCANQMVSLKPTAAVYAALASTTPDTIITRAGIPYVSAQPSGPADFTTPGMFLFNSGASDDFVAQAYWLKQHGSTSTAWIVDGGGNAVSSADEFVVPTFKKLGMKIKVIPYPPGSADASPELEAASSYNAVQYSMDENGCIANMKAATAVGANFTFKTAYILCATKAVFSEAGPAVNGMVFTTTNTGLNPNDPDSKIYNDAMSKYAPGTDKEGYAATSFVSIMNLVNLWKSSAFPKGTQINAASTLAAFKHSKDVPSFLTDGQTFTCNGSAAPPGLPNVCGNLKSVDVIQYKNGRLHYLESITLPSGS